MMMKLLLIRSLALVLCIGTTASSSYAHCTLNVGKGETAKEWDAIFTQKGPGTGLEPKGIPGWTGADSTISIELPNGDSAFFFSDSFIGEWPPMPGDGRVHTNTNGLRLRTPNCLPPICGPEPEHIHYVYNSIVVRSKDGKTLRTLVGEKDKFGYSTSYFKPKDPKNLYWMGDAVIMNVDGKKKIWIFLNEWNVARPYDKASWIEFRGQAIAQLDADTLAIDKIVPLRNWVDEGVWGISLWLDDHKGSSDLYIYGMRNEGKIVSKNSAGMDVVDRYKKLYIAKVDASRGLESIADESTWLAWDGKGWSADLRKRGSIIPESDSISDELTIRRLNIAGKPTFVMVTFDTSVGYTEWKDLYLYSACEPQGPFHNKTFFYRTPTAGQTLLPGMTGKLRLKSGLSVYNPHMHPQFSHDGKLLVSYNSNLPFGSKPGDSIYADFYKPRFVWVPIEGLER
ncbi:MAG: hypothetical protein IT172_01725 [Acidobacteria bacterium]|nr:hypothetical protein [Acidobacteriota bacterium]